MNKDLISKNSHPVQLIDETRLLEDLRELIYSARQRVATTANSEQTLMYWGLGQRIFVENLTEGRAGYGKKILATLSQKLMGEFGEGFSLRNLYRAVQFYQAFPDRSIVSTLSTQLSWSHFIEILPIKEGIAREFYAEMCRVERWPVRILRENKWGLLLTHDYNGNESKADLTLS